MTELVNVILPRGITGFNVPKGHPAADPVSFHSDCWQVVASRSGRVEDRQQVLAPDLVNFITRVLVLPSQEVTVLLNRYYSWLGFCVPLQPGHCQIEFVDPHRVMDAFAALGRYQILSSTELDQPVTLEMCAELGRGELDQLKYWTKTTGRGHLTVGEVVFNCWD